MEYGLLLSKIAMFTSLKLLSGVLFLKIMLLRIETQKKLFLAKIEQGVDTLILPDIS